MNKETKVQEVGMIKDMVDSSIASYLVSLTACSCSDLTSLRADLRSSGARLKVVKNTLVKRALNESNIEGMDEWLTGPNALVWAEEDPVAPAKILKKFGKDRENFVIKGGYFEGKVIPDTDVNAIAEMPSREELLAKLLYVLNAPATNLLRVINAPARDMAGVIDAQRREIEKKGE